MQLPTRAWRVLRANAVPVLVGLLIAWAANFAYEVATLRDIATGRLHVSAGATVHCTRRLAPRMTCWVGPPNGIDARITVWATGVVVVGKVPEHFFLV